MSWTRFGMIVVIALLVACEKDNPIKCTGLNDPVCDATPGTVCKRVSLPDMSAVAFRCLPEDAKCEQKPSVYLATTVCGADAPLCGNQCANMSCSCAKCSDFAGQEDQMCATAYSGALSFCTNGACVQCKGTGATSVGCPTTAPVCDGNSKCGPCTKHSDCSSGLCRMADYAQAPVGTCVTEPEIAYVEKGNANCKDAGGTGTKASPFCEISAAVGANKQFVVVRTGTYAGFTASGMARVLIGPGRDIDNSAIVTSPIIADGAVMYAEGFRVSLPGAAIPVNAAVICKNSGSLILAQSIVMGSPSSGVGAFSGCKQLTVLNSQIRENVGTGLVVDPVVNYRVVGSLISQNGGGADFGTGAKGTFLFNTVAKNDMSGVICRGMNQLLEASIIVQNGAVGTGLGITPQGLDGCTFSSTTAGSATDPVTMGLILAPPPGFAGNGRAADNYKLKDTSQMCCSRKVATNAQVPADFFGKLRSVTTDIGFAESP